MYEVGDKVIYQGADKNAYRKRGVVKSIEDKDGKPQLTVELEGGETFTAPIDDWSREFSNACTSTNSVVRNAVAARNAVARNALTVEQQREFKSNILPKVERDVSAYEKGCKDVISSAKAIAAKISALAKEAKKLGGKVTELRARKIDNLFSIEEYDESIGDRLYNNFLDAKSSLYEARNAVLDAGYECVNAIKI